MRTETPSDLKVNRQNRSIQDEVVGHLRKAGVEWNCSDGAFWPVVLMEHDDARGQHVEKEGT